MPVMVQDPRVAAQPSAAPSGTVGGQPGPVAAGHAAGRKRLPGPGVGRPGGPRGQRPHAAPPAVRRAEDDAERQDAWGVDQELDAEACFAPLLAWVLSWMTSSGPGAPPPLALAVDPTHQADRLVALTVSVVLNQTAIPVAWRLVPAQASLSWMVILCRLLGLLAPAVPPGTAVHVLCDRGLYSPRLWRRIRSLGWHPCLRCDPDPAFRPEGQTEARPAAAWGGGEGTLWVGRGMASPRHRPLPGTLVVLHGRGHEHPRVLLTDTPPDRTEATLYACRDWIEQGFRGPGAPAGSGSARGAPTRCAPGGTGWCWPWPPCWRGPTARVGRKPPPSAATPHGCGRPRRPSRP